MLLGIWKNVEELEMYISLDELELILEAAREQEYNRNKFAAALKGIDLDKQNQQSAEEAMERVRMRAQARLTGESVEKLEFDALGIDIETE